VATGEHVANRVVFKQLLQAEAVDIVQIDAARVGGINENIAILLLAAKFGVPVVLLRTVPIEAAAVMVPPAAEPEPEAVREYRGRLVSVPVEELDRFAFYAQARSDDVALLIVTADVRTYANLLLTIGVRSN